MAHVLRFGTPKLGSTGLSSLLCKVSQNYNVLPAAWINSKANRTDLVPRPKPFPYWRKKLTMITDILDPIMYRFDENSKILAVDGPPAMGKAVFAKELAEKLDMLYMPPPSFDDICVYKNAGIDIRSFNDIFEHENNKIVDLEFFLKNPRHRGVGVFQLAYFYMRMDQYLNALLHMLSTGQGVVLCRTPFSDEVFRRLLLSYEYISQQAFVGMRRISEYSLRMFPKPHLIIYLDAPPNIVKENILKRNIPYEVNSDVLNLEYLERMDNIYKEHLKQMERHSYIVTYDWSVKNDIDLIVHDIESIDFQYTTEEEKLGSWIFPTVAIIQALRAECQGKHNTLLSLEPIRGEMPDEFYVKPAEIHEIDEAFRKVPVTKYAPGYHPDYDGNMLLKPIDHPGDAICTLIRNTVRDFTYRDPKMV